MLCLLFNGGKEKKTHEWRRWMAMEEERRETECDNWRRRKVNRSEVKRVSGKRDMRKKCARRNEENVKWTMYVE